MEYGNDNITSVISSEQTTIVSKICKCTRYFYCFCDGQDAALNYLKTYNVCNIPCSIHIYASYHGHLDILKWLKTQQIPLMEFTGIIQKAAVYNNHLNILKWLGTIQQPCSWNATPCTVALECDHLEILKWLISNNAPIYPLFGGQIEIRCLNYLFEINKINAIQDLEYSQEIKRMKILISGEF